MAYHMKTAVVTGAGGFIGHHLVRFLKGQGCGSYRTTAKPRKIRLFCKFAGFIQVIFPEI